MSQPSSSTTNFANRFRSALTHVDALPQLSILAVVIGSFTGLLIVGFRIALEAPVLLFPMTTAENFEELSVLTRINIILSGSLAIALALKLLTRQQRQMSVGHVIDRIYKKVVSVIKVGIVGGTGYTGSELLRLLSQHPKVEVQVITSRAEAGRRVDELFPNLRSHFDLSFSAPNSSALLDCDLIFFATPHGVAQSMMKEIINGGARVVDLSADFRIRDIDIWEQWYKQKHACPELVELAVYGLPEQNREAIRSAQLVACPGCYPTSVQLGLKPLLDAQLIQMDDIIVNATSGISGAGKSANTSLLLAENYDSFKPYAVSGHRHLPEIEQGLLDIAGSTGSDLSVTFVPHLLPTIRGILSTIYVKVLDKAINVQGLYEQTYENEAFVDVLPEGMYPETRSVKGTNVCRIAVQNPLKKGQLVIMSAIDNLAKGASSQAIQNMNLMFDLDESLALSQPALMP